MHKGRWLEQWSSGHKAQFHTSDLHLLLAVNVMTENHTKFTHYTSGVKINIA